MKRELNKAYTGFATPESTPSKVATGLWGCGAFGGNPEFKALIQLLAASLAGRDMVFFAYGNAEFYQDFENFLTFLQSFPKLTIGELYKILALFCDRVNGTGVESRGFDATVFEFCTEQLTQK